MELCALAAEEQDSDKLLELTQEINKLLTEKEQRLKGKQYQALPPNQPFPGKPKTKPRPRLKPNGTTTRNREKCFLLALSSPQPEEAYIPDSGSAGSRSGASQAD